MGRSAVRRIVAVLGAIGVVVALSSCGGGGGQSAAAPTGSFGGRVPASDAFVSVVAGKANVVVWICDGAHQVALRFSGPRTGNGFDITLPLGARVAGTIAGNQAAGSVTTGTDAPRPFTATATTGAAGLYTATGKIDADEVGLAWVVLNDGQQRGSELGRFGIRLPPPLDTKTRKATLGAGNTTTASRSNPGGGGGFGGGFGGFGGGQFGQSGNQIGQFGQGQFGQFGGQGGFQGGQFGQFGQFGGQGGFQGGQFGQFGGQGGQGGFQSGQFGG
jgi:hypothetical protein